MNKFFVTVMAGLASATTELYQESFDSMVFAPQEKGWFVKFYAPWCPHCQALAPVWDQFSDEHPEVNVGAVDCTDNSSKYLCVDYMISGYPTLLYFPPVADDARKKYYEYKKNRAIDGFADFVTNYDQMWLKQ